MGNQLPTIKSLWIGGALGQIEHLALRSFISCGHEVELFTYSPVKNVPTGVTLRDGNEILSFDKVFKYKKYKSYSGFSNWFRYKLLFDEGGVWVDTDVICLKPLAFNKELFFGKEETGQFGSAVLGGRAGNRLFDFMRNQSQFPNSFLPYDTLKIKIRKIKRKYIQGNQRSNIKWGEIGPAGLTKAIFYFGLEGYGLPVTYFYPIHSRCWDTCFDDTYSDPDKFFPHSYTVHLWNQMITRDPHFNLNVDLSTNSLFKSLIRKYQ